MAMWIPQTQLGNSSQEHQGSHSANELHLQSLQHQRSHLMHLYLTWKYPAASPHHSKVAQCRTPKTWWHDHLHYRPRFSLLLMNGLILQFPIDGELSPNQRVPLEQCLLVIKHEVSLHLSHRLTRSTLHSLVDY